MSYTIIEIYCTDPSHHETRWLVDEFAQPAQMSGCPCQCWTRRRASCGDPTTPMSRWMP